MAETQTKVSM